MDLSITENQYKLKSSVSTMGFVIIISVCCPAKRDVVPALKMFLFPLAEQDLLHKRL